jgi:hypothetical protein
MSVAVEALSYEANVERPGKAAFWIGWTLSALLAMAFAMGGVTDVLKLPFVIEGLERAHFNAEMIRPLGVVVIVSAILFLIPRTAVFGAVLLTAYLGGAVTVHTQLREYAVLPMPIAFCAVMWVALMLRDARFRRLLFRAC